MIVEKISLTLYFFHPYDDNNRCIYILLNTSPQQMNKS